MHPIQDLFLESFSYVLQFDVHFYMHSYVDKNFILVKSGCYSARVYKASFQSSVRQCNVLVSTQKKVEWLRHRMDQYRSTTNEMCKAIEDFDEVEILGQGFTSANPLEEIDIGDEITPRLTFVNKNMSLEHKDTIIKLIKDLLIVSSRVIVKCPVLTEN
jgi:hypothetical protein